MKANARVQNGRIQFASSRAEAYFLEKAKGKELVIIVDDAASSNKRKYFEGAIIPAVFYQTPRSGWQNFKECREALKLEFIPGWTKTTKGERVKYSRSTTELSNLAFGKFLEEITHWMVEQGMEYPDPEEYKAWRDSAPPPGEVYPQLARLKQRYDEGI